MFRQHRHINLPNRCVVVVRPKQPFVDWLNRTMRDPGARPYELDGLRKDVTSYLVPVFYDHEHLDAWLAEGDCYQHIALYEITQWTTDYKGVIPRKNGHN